MFIFCCFPPVVKSWTKQGWHRGQRNGQLIIFLCDAPIHLKGILSVALKLSGEACPCIKLNISFLLKAERLLQNMAKWSRGPWGENNLAYIISAQLETPGVLLDNSEKNIVIATPLCLLSADSSPH